MQTLYVMQGASGSGKSTLAVVLAKATGAVICSTDSYFLTEGVYRFDPSKLGEYHASNQRAAAEHLQAGHSVIVDNTNLLRSHVKPYVAAAVALGVPVVFIRCEGQFPNSHGVPAEKVQQMREVMQELSVKSVLAS